MPADSKADDKIIDVQCSANGVEEVGDAERAIYDVTDHVIANTANSFYNYEYHEKVGDNDAWGNGACNGVLSNPDCANCITIANDYLTVLCPFKAGARIKLADCRMRFEQYKFSGPW
ncbi:hypothetical protein MLD38_035776 [Melastoma candidum]|uniref:Uncharacterized protein n=1 Tax=Melastoma candidum TaxID=119954 RepID=A0ACB9LHM6_9MYRT|nr:hypothetical protein MLD38_035776 [Melastoma candidum]